MFVVFAVVVMLVGVGAAVAIVRRRAALRVWDAELAVALARDEPRAPLLAHRLGRHRGRGADA